MRKNPRAKWVLPDTTNPTDRLCFTIEVPNERYHIAAFRGALLNLASAINWQDDPYHKAKDVALVWRDIVDQVEACLTTVNDVRQNTDSPCSLEKTFDGVTWSQFADLSLCKNSLTPDMMQTWFRVSGGVTQYSHDGVTFYTFPENGLPQWNSEPPYPGGSGVPSGQTAQCLTATNLASLLQQEVTEWITRLNAGATIFGIITIIAAIGVAIFTAGFAAPAIPAVAAAITGMGASGLGAFFTSGVYDEIKCIIDCHAASDGSINGSQFSAIMNDIQSKGSAAGWLLVQLWFNLRGPVGLTNSAKMAGITTGDCSSCGCEEYADLIISSNGSFSSVVRLSGHHYRYTLNNASDRTIQDRLGRCFTVSNVTNVSGTGFAAGTTTLCNGSTDSGDWTDRSIKISEYHRSYTEALTVWEFDAVLS